MLQIINSIGFLDMAPVTGRLVQRIAADLSTEREQSDEHTWEALRRLEDEGWITRAPGSLGLRDALWSMTTCLPSLWLDLAPWFAGNRENVPEEYWRAVLLKCAERAAHDHRVDVLGIVAALAPTLPTDSDARSVLAQSLISRGLLGAAAELLATTRYEVALSARHALAGAALHHKESRFFFGALAALRDPDLDTLIRDLPPWTLRDRFETLAEEANHDTTYETAMRRFTAALDRVQPWQIEYPSFTAAFEQFVRKATKG